VSKYNYFFGVFAALSLILSSFTLVAVASEKPSDKVEQHCVTHLKRTAGGATEVAARNCAASESAAYEGLPVGVRFEANEHEAGDGVRAC
jgi:hypothetical protein